MPKPSSLIDEKILGPLRWDNYPHCPTSRRWDPSLCSQSPAVSWEFILVSVQQAELVVDPITIPFLPSYELKTLTTQSPLQPNLALASEI